jgi:hypothetical protein
VYAVLGVLLLLAIGVAVREVWLNQEASESAQAAGSITEAPGQKLTFNLFYENNTDEVVAGETTGLTEIHIGKQFDILSLEETFDVDGDGSLEDENTYEVCTDGFQQENKLGTYVANRLWYVHRSANDLQSCSGQIGSSKDDLQPVELPKGHQGRLELTVRVQEKILEQVNPADGELFQLGDRLGWNENFSGVYFVSKTSSGNTDVYESTATKDVILGGTMTTPENFSVSSYKDVVTGNDQEVQVGNLAQVVFTLSGGDATNTYLLPDDFAAQIGAADSVGASACNFTNNGDLVDDDNDESTPKVPVTPVTLTCEVPTNGLSTADYGVRVRAQGTSQSVGQISLTETSEYFTVTMNLEGQGEVVSSQSEFGVSGYGSNGYGSQLIECRNFGDNSSKCSAEVLAGNQLELTASPASNYQFSSWSAGCSQNPCSLTVDQDYNLTATFEHGELLITEINWSGTSAASGDEWIELYNPSSQPIDLSEYNVFGVGNNNYPGMQIANGNFSQAKVDVNNQVQMGNTAGTCENTVVQPGEYFLISARPADSSGSLLNVEPDCYYTNPALMDISDSGEKITISTPGQSVVEEVGN